MKIKTIIRAFTEPQGEKAVIVKVFDSVDTFKRKLELLPSYKELKEVNQMYQYERQKIVNEIVDGYNKDTDNKVKQVPRHLMPELGSKLDDVLETDHKLKKPLKFTEEEIEKSGINISEMETIEEFLNLK